MGMGKYFQIYVNRKWITVVGIVLIQLCNHEIIRPTDPIDVCMVHRWFSTKVLKCAAMITGYFVLGTSRKIK